MKPNLGRIMIYTTDADRLAAFYERFFGFTSHRTDGDPIIELIPAEGGAGLMIHPVVNRTDEAQERVRLVFDVDDVEEFGERCAAVGLEFGPVYRYADYRFSNTHDPDMNPIQISGRPYPVAGWHTVPQTTT